MGGLRQAGQREIEPHWQPEDVFTGRLPFFQGRLFLSPRRNYACEGIPMPSERDEGAVEIGYFEAFDRTVGGSPSRLMFIQRELSMERRSSRRSRERGDFRRGGAVHRSSGILSDVVRAASFWFLASVRSTPSSRRESSVPCDSPALLKCPGWPGRCGGRVCRRHAPAS
jgi:hypothetical protein